MTKPACLWMRCPDCDDRFCRFHWKHVFECECPDLETMLEDEVDPYLPGSLKKYAQQHKQKRNHEP